LCIPFELAREVVAGRLRGRIFQLWAILADHQGVDRNFVRLAVDIQLETVRQQFLQHLEGFFVGDGLLALGFGGEVVFVGPDRVLAVPVMREPRTDGSADMVTGSGWNLIEATSNEVRLPVWAAAINWNSAISTNLIR